MPAAMPPPDLRFDHQAAADAIAELERTRAAIEDIVDSVEAALLRALRHWRGATRGHAEQAWARHRTTLRSAANELERLAREFAGAIDTARAEQHRRELVQAHWELERRTELSP